MFYTDGGVGTANLVEMRTITMQPDEIDPLVRGVLQRDRTALAAYIDANRAQLTGFIRSIAGQRLLGVVEVDDILQELAATALQTIETAPLDTYLPMNWLQHLARQRVIDAHRFHFAAQRRNASRQRSIHAPTNENAEGLGIEHLLVASMTSASAAMSQDIRVNRMHQALAQLTQEQSNAIRMRYIEGMPTKQIAALLGKSDVAIRVLLSRSMRQLETLLADVKPDR